MDYWVVINRQKFGPLTLEELKAMPVKEDSYVWHSGLTGWMRASEVPELAVLFQAPPVEPETSIEPEAPKVVLPPPPPAPPVGKPAELPEKPPTYLGWSIAALICCCLVFGVVAVVYSAKVTPLYEQGDYEGAKKASERAELWLIIAITAGLVMFPFQLIFSMI